MKPDFKHLILRALEGATSINGDAPLYIILCLPFGLISGTPPAPGAASSQINGFVRSTREALVQTPDGHIDNDCLILRDVTVLTSGTKLYMEEIAVFYHDISGFSIGKI